jgi:hypothetical protein
VRRRVRSESCFPEDGLQLILIIISLHHALQQPLHPPLPSRGSDVNKPFQRNSSHHLTAVVLIRVAGSHILPIPIIGPEEGTYKTQEKQGLLYSIDS